MALLAFEGVAKSYPRSGVVFEPFDLEIDEGDFVGAWGERRSGKSTLLRLAAGIEAPDGGRIRFGGRDLAGMSESERSILRRTEIGIAATSTDTASLLADRSSTVVEQVALPLIFQGASHNTASKLAHHFLRMVGVGDCISTAPWELRAGEITRVALARALVREPRLLLVDEPAITHSPEERDAIRELLHDLSRRLQLAMLVASEEITMMAGAPRILSVGDGKVISNEQPGTVIEFPGSRLAGGEASER
ncbi:MAG TPA: ATP-binding cassette domain-containing protein [Gaiellaceae bacterium]|nr:ATP-binding cassette domain-containing protein [Gaiellaceae bacterium]